MSRQDAYAAVQRHAMKVWREGGDFQAAPAADPEVARHLDAGTLSELFDLGYLLRHVDDIFARVFGKSPAVAKVRSKA